MAVTAAGLEIAMVSSRFLLFFGLMGLMSTPARLETVDCVHPNISAAALCPPLIPGKSYGNSCL